MKEKPSAADDAMCNRHAAIAVAVAVAVRGHVSIYQILPLVFVKRSWTLAIAEPGKHSRHRLRHSDR